MKLVDYKAPKWLLNHSLFKHFESKIPQKRFDFIKKPTRIDKLDVTGVSKRLNNYEIWVKRDDLIHDLIYLQGNKLRKLEFIFADAVQKSQNKQQIHVLSAGGLQSNHARAVAGVANMLDMKAHLFLRSHTRNVDELNLSGNLLLDRLLGANVYLIEKRAQYLQSIELKMRELERRLLEKHRDASVYLIPIGGSNLVGLFGYLEAFDELIDGEQSIENKIDDIIVTTGSGGTMAALAIANYLTGQRFGLHAFCVCDNSAYFYKHLQDQLEELLSREVVMQLDLNARSMVNIVECSRGLGYARSTRDSIHAENWNHDRSGLHGQINVHAIQSITRTKANVSI